jgi:predicted regulator of Ras-like GTPase activity (Roadblock/LC7/MglB family)
LPTAAKPVPMLRPRRPTTRVAAVDLSGLRRISGFSGGCLMDSLSGQVLASEAGIGEVETTIRATLTIARANLQAAAELGAEQEVEDIQIAMGQQFHLLRPLDGAARYLVCVTLDREAANLGLARIQLRRVAQSIRL